MLGMGSTSCEFPYRPQPRLIPTVSDVEQVGDATPAADTTGVLSLGDILQIVLAILSLLCAITTAIWGPCFSR